MINISNKCNNYDADVKQAENLLRFKKVIFIAPCVLFAILSIVLWIATSNATMLALLIIPVVYVIVMAIILPMIFDKHCKAIVDEYFKYYSVSNNEQQTLLADVSKYQELLGGEGKNVSAPWCVLVNDNQGFTQKMRKDNVLFTRNVNNSLKCVSVFPILIAKETYFGARAGYVKGLVAYDTGCLTIPIDDIDHYRENMMTCSFGADALCKITFSNSAMMDALIPKKDFYYQTSKKEKED